MAEPSKKELLAMAATRFDTDSLSFVGCRGDPATHLDRKTLLARLAALPPAPRDSGTVDLLLARGTSGERTLLEEAQLTIAGGMPGDRWAVEERYGLPFQLATTRTDFARVVANGQPLHLHGDNLFLSLDLSRDNLPTGTRLRLGEAEVHVTPQEHNGCKKWVQRFGLPAMQLNMAAEYRSRHLRGIYLQVVKEGRVRRHDEVVVLRRG